MNLFANRIRGELELHVVTVTVAVCVSSKIQSTTSRTVGGTVDVDKSVRAHDLN